MLPHYLLNHDIADVRHIRISTIEQRAQGPALAQYDGPVVGPCVSPRRWPLPA
jgi:hypothetical protein